MNLKQLAQRARELLRSITLKLALAFVLVSVLGIVLVAFIVQQRTQRAFDQFVQNRTLTDFESTLVEYYTVHSSWEGVEAVILDSSSPAPPPWERRFVPFVLVDTDQNVVFGGERYQAGGQAPQPGHLSVPIEVDGEVVGWLLIDSPPYRQVPRSPEADFIKRLSVAAVTSALLAAAIALVVGGLLAQTLSRPIRELTAATRMVADGALGYQVKVRTRDELGELASSFNQMSADLAQAHNLRRQMTADIAHELRTPLSVILGYTEAMSEGKLNGTPETFDVMYEEALHLQRLIDDLRTLSLADAGELPLTRQSVSPGSLLERTAVAYKPQAQQRRIAIQVRVQPDLPEVAVDPDRIAQVLGNLVSNALRYTPENGTIVLSAERGDETVLLRVQDNGAGIAPEDVPHIFARFYRGDKSRRVQDGESGLGLAIAKSIVDAHGGAITVESVYREGTTFTVTLPLT
jgi:signal transduction histidine kinase